MTISDRIRNRRLELGLSVDDLAARLGKNRATVYRYESNYIKTYSADVMEALAAALETTPAYFYGYEDHNPPDVMPVSRESRIISEGIDRMPKERREQALKILQVAFSEYADYFKEDADNDA